MEHYNKFKKQARIIYHIASQSCNTLDGALNSRTYLFAYLDGYIDALVDADVCTRGEIKMCRQYAVAVYKALTKYHIRNKF